MNIVLIGFMCSGKSRVGRALAKKLGWPHLDTDEMITKDVGMSIAEIIHSQGEPAFREIEKKAVQLVSVMDKSIISTGGGVPLDAKNREALTQNGSMVWLQVSPETVLKRAGNLKSRPLIDPRNPLESIRKKLAERESLYSLAPYKIDVNNLTPEIAAEKILQLIPAITA